MVHRVVTTLTNGEQVSFEASRTPAGLVRRHRYETEPDGQVGVFSDHTHLRSDGTEEIVDTFRIARFAPGNLARIETLVSLSTSTPVTSSFGLSRMVS